MPVVVAQANTITLMVGADQIECQITSHNLTDADPAQGEQTRTGCGDIVIIPADTTELGTLDLTLFPDRGDPATSFVAWSWAHAGETATFDLVVNYEGGALEYAGEVTVAAVPEKQDAYTVIETVDVSWTVTKWTKRALAPVTP